MSQEELIARRYAKGLAERAVEAGSMDAVREGLGVLADALDPRREDAYVPELAAILASPEVETADKLALAGRILDSAGLDGDVGGFFRLLIEKGRVGLLPRIRRAFLEIAGPMTGERTAIVETAMPLTPVQEARLSRALADAFGGAVRLHQRVVPSLVAGARVTVGDRTFDGSATGRLERLRDELTATVRREAGKAGHSGEKGAAAAPGGGKK